MPVAERCIGLFARIDTSHWRRSIPHVAKTVDVPGRDRGFDGDEFGSAFLGAFEIVSDGEFINPGIRLIFSIERIREGAVRIGLCRGSVFAIAVGDETLTDRAGDLLPLVDFALDLDGCVLHGYRLHFSCGLNFKRHVFGKVVSARGHHFAQGVGAGQKMLDAMRFVRGGPSVYFGSVGTVEGEPGAIYFLFAGQIDFGDVDFGVVVRNVEVRIDHGCFLTGIRQLDGVDDLVEQVTFGCLHLDYLIGGGSAPQ